MPATTTSSQPMPLAPINTSLRSRSDSNGMGSPTSLMSNFSSDCPLSVVSTESSQTSNEGPSISPLMTSKAPKTTRPHAPRYTYTHPMESRTSTDSVDSQGRLKFNDFSRGRHSNIWLFRSVSIRSTIKNTFSKMVTKH